MNISKDSLIRWVVSEELDNEFSKLEEDDPDGFQDSILSACDDEMLLGFASNRSSRKRSYFANHLTVSLCWIYRQDFGFPYHFSRLQGLMDIEDYNRKILWIAQEIHKKCKIIEKMRKSDQKEIKMLAEKILDKRNRLDQFTHNFYEIIKEVQGDIKFSFAENIDAYQLRICKACGADFAYWYNSHAGVNESAIACSSCGAPQKRA